MLGHYRIFPTPIRHRYCHRSESVSRHDLLSLLLPTWSSSLPKAPSPRHRHLACMRQPTIRRLLFIAIYTELCFRAGFHVRRFKWPGPVVRNSQLSRARVHERIADATSQRKLFIFMEMCFCI